MRGRKWYFLRVMILTLGLCNGCITCTVWNWAQPAVHPVADTLGEHVQMMSGDDGRWSFVVMYKVLSTDAPRPLVIPLDSSGKPMPPFDYTGRILSSNEDADFLRHIPPDQLEALNHQAPSTIDRRQLRVAPWEQMANPQPIYDFFDASVKSERIYAFAYEMKQSGPVMVRTPLADIDSASGSASEVPRRQVNVVLFPSRIIPPDPGQPGRVAAAAFGTPFTLAADIGLMPVTITVGLVGWTAYILEEQKR